MRLSRFCVIHVGCGVDQTGYETRPLNPPRRIPRKFQEDVQRRNKPQVRYARKPSSQHRLPPPANGRPACGPAWTETGRSIRAGTRGVDKFVVCQEGWGCSFPQPSCRTAWRGCAIARSGIQTSVRLRRSDILAHSNAGSARYFFCFSSITVLAARALTCWSPDQRAALLHLSGVTAVGVAQCWNTFPRHSRRSAATLHGQIWKPDI